MVSIGSTPKSACSDLKKKTDNTYDNDEFPAQQEDDITVILTVAQENNISESLTSSATSQPTGQGFVHHEGVDPKLLQVLYHTQSHDLYHHC